MTNGELKKANSLIFLDQSNLLHIYAYLWIQTGHLRLILTAKATCQQKTTLQENKISLIQVNFRLLLLYRGQIVLESFDLISLNKKSALQFQSSRRKFCLR